MDPHLSLLASFGLQCVSSGLFVVLSAVVSWRARVRRRQRNEMLALLPVLYTAGNNSPRRNTDNMRKISFSGERQSFFKTFATELNFFNSKIIHVAGTKGKGSNCEYIAAGLRENGYSVGVFTSPHIHTARERIKIGKSLISVSDFIRLSSLALEDLKDVSWTCFFDIFLCMAIRYFSEKKVDYVVLETGIGGLLDSTNFVPSPTITVITNIGLDHQNVLGDTIEEIAAQKAGIIKHGVPLFTTEKQQPSVLEVISKTAEANCAPFYIVKPQLKNLSRSRKSYIINSHFSIQEENAALAIAVLDYLGVNAEKCLNAFYWPCRMELFYLNCKGCSFPIVIDGNHNGESTRLFLRGLRKQYPDYLLIVLFGSGADKCTELMAEEVLSGADMVVPVQARHFKSAALDKVVSLLRQKKNLNGGAEIRDCDPSGDIVKTIDTLIDYVGRRSRNSRKVVIGTCGSLFVASETREYLFRIIPDAFALDDWVRDADGMI